MRISQGALDQCEPLFQGFMDQMNVVTTFRVDLFKAVESQRDLFSETLRALTHYQSDRCRGVYCLLINGLSFDAEVALRSFYEAVAKSLFLSTATPERREQLLEEFWDVLPAVYDAKGADRAAAAEKLAKRFDRSDDERVFAFLRNPKWFVLERIGNRQFRNDVEQRWSFSRIIETLKKTNPDHSRIPEIDSLLHNYSIASHIAHASPIAFDLLEDRALRGDDLILLEITHIARMLCDMISLSIFGLHQAQVALLEEMPIADALRQAFENMTALTHPHQQAFRRSQDEFYQKHMEDKLSQ